ncbi:Cse1-domain-containing protein [Pseudomassariella vexata]|uniref:Cse1-domain-containing protein n=1 Tax=Pseudomassariella vexata TaxID=1141098 RepID=A0A1Y2EHT2_9PEZI|nr:Cse1-domain-containing protein [Pseudomassariella vexata]ORY71129.1 Cse1-domain-containing protein [Pseudomassariella vexata]
MASDLERIVQLLDATLDPTKHRKAETALKIEEKKPRFSLLLLQIVHAEQLPVNTRLAASLCFKNFIRFNYVDASGNYKLPADEVSTIKQELIGLMIACPPTIQTQLGDAISLIADSDFWERWDTLVQDLVSRLSPDDAKVNNGVLEVAHSIFQRWRPLYRSDDLFMEINHVLNTFATPFLSLLNATDQQITANANNKDALKPYFDTLSLLVKVFYDLSCQDMPPQFENNLEQISTLLHKYLTYENPILATDDESEAGVLENVKADICEALELYTSKYDDDFGRYTQVFITSAWNLLSSIGPETKYDNLVSKALHFLTAIASVERHAQNFNDENVLNSVVEKVILPNVALRETDIELFEDEPIEFIRRDLEGSDTDSRRRAATDFLRTLQEKFEQLVTNVAGKYINHYLEQGKGNWKDKDTAISLFLSIAAKGAVTAGQGVKTVNSLVNVVDFFQQHIASDLITDNGVEPISKVDAIKYLYTFRSQLTKEQWQAAFQPLIQNMGSSNYVVYTYAAIAVERVLYLTDDQGNHVFSRPDIEPFAKDLLEHLFKLVEKEQAPAKMQENEFLMRCIMRVLIVMKEGVMPFADLVLDHLVKITNVIKENPSNPRFYYYHFEALGALVRLHYTWVTQPLPHKIASNVASSGASTKLEERLWEPFNQILTEEVNEFIPYVFQLFSALLESNPASALPNHYKSLITPLLQHTLWETRGNVPGCTRLLAAIVPRASQDIVAANQVEPILGIFQKLLVGKKTEQNAFDVLESVVISIPKTSLEKFFTTILQLVLNKLDHNPAESYKKRLVRFYHLISANVDIGLGADFFVAQMDKVREEMKVQADIFVPLYLKTVLPVSPLFASPVDRKLAVVSLTKSLAETQAFGQRYQKGWRFTCETLLTMLTNAPKATGGTGDEIIREADVDDIGFGLGFTALNTCKKPPRDDFPEVQDVPQWVRQYLTQANAARGGVIASYVDRLSDEGKQAFAMYMG